MNITNKQIESQALNTEVEKFLKAGGVIQTLPRGYSGESHNLVIGKKCEQLWLHQLQVLTLEITNQM